MFIRAIKQTGTVGQPLGSPLQVLVTDALGNPVSGATVSWSPDPGDGSAGPTTSATNGSGIASTSWTLGSSPGSQSLDASVGGAGSVTFSANAQAGAPANIVIQSGNNQTGTVGQTLSSPLQVLVTDSENNPLSGVTVSWAPDPGDGSASPTTSATNGSGIASSSWTLGSTAGGQTLSAGASGAGSANFSATAEAGAPANIDIQSGNNQSGTVGHD